MLRLTKYDSRKDGKKRKGRGLEELLKSLSDPRLRSRVPYLQILRDINHHYQLQNIQVKMKPEYTRKYHNFSTHFQVSL